MSGRVLVVDDVEINVKLLEAKLASEYFEVLAARSGRTALEIAAAEQPDVILLDVMMPHMDGFEVCRRLKANPKTTDLPVVMVTALSDAADRVRGLEAGADDFLTKPASDIALFARVRSLVRLKRMMQEWRLRDEICGRFGGPPTAIEADGPGRVLIIEEDPFAAARMTETLAIAHRVTLAHSNLEAQACVDAETELVIASLTLPDGDSLRLVTQWRGSETFRQLPILLIAAEPDLPRLAKGLDLGANDYLVRPVDRNELLARTGTQIRRKRLQDRLDENYRRSLSLALTDELTGLYNRRYALAHLDELIGRLGRDSVGTAILLFDIDHFKLVNDTHGHAAGDDVLRELAARACSAVRSVDLVARLGGEEFVVIMPETGAAIAAVVAERLRLETSREPFVIRPSGARLHVTISVGVTLTVAGGDERRSLLERADMALYEAKSAGRNRVVIHTPEIGDRNTAGRNIADHNTGLAASAGSDQAAIGGR
ncbi:MAG TPA: PleD family two-component system response regulator [Stellaceae bacterium]|nr:PleD family two-component system response regulator [Stellaceae bacterium]